MKRFEIKVGDHTIIFANNDGETLAVTLRGPDVSAALGGSHANIELDGVSIKDIHAATDKICKQLKALCETKLEKLAAKLYTAKEKGFSMILLEDLHEVEVDFEVNEFGAIYITNGPVHRKKNIFILDDTTEFDFTNGNLNFKSSYGRETIHIRKTEKFKL